MPAEREAEDEAMLVEEQEGQLQPNEDEDDEFWREEDEEGGVGS